jgi:hypothetical protein
LVSDQRDAQILFYVFILFIPIYMFRARRAHHQERQIVINTASGNFHSMLVAVSCAGWNKILLPTCTHLGHLHRMTAEAVLIQFVSPDDEHDVLETCREL